MDGKELHREQEREEIRQRSLKLETTAERIERLRLEGLLTTQEFLRARCGETVMGDDGFIALKVTARYDLQADGTALSILATQDGRGAVCGEWHAGPEAEAVYFETWTLAGRMDHGWIDAVTRKVVQTG